MIFNLNEVNMTFLGILFWQILYIFLIEGLLVQEITLTKVLWRKLLMELLIGCKTSTPDVYLLSNF